jgi:hypothetical protein
MITMVCATAESHAGAGRARRARSYGARAGGAPVAAEELPPAGQTPAQPAARCGAHVKLHSNSA